MNFDATLNRTYNVVNLDNHVNMGSINARDIANTSM